MKNKHRKEKQKKKPTAQQGFLTAKAFRAAHGLTEQQFVQLLATRYAQFALCAERFDKRPVMSIKATSVNMLQMLLKTVDGLLTSAKDRDLILAALTEFKRRYEAIAAMLEKAKQKFMENTGWDGQTHRKWCRRNWRRLRRI